MEMVASLLTRPLNLGRLLTKPTLISRLRVINAYSTTQTPASNAVSGVLDDDGIDEIDRLRNVSRLPAYLRNRMGHVQKLEPLIESSRFHHRKSPNADRFRYARFGRESGVDPGVMWWTREQLELVKEDEVEWEKSLQQMWTELAAEKKANEEARRLKEENVSAQMERMPQLIETFRKKLHKRREVEAGLRDKHNEKAARAREYFGFDMDTKDPRYEHMEALQEEEAKQAKKKQRREVKAARILSA